MTNFLSDIITYVRRIIKSPSNAVITDNLIIDYINRFWLMDVDARIQLFDLKSTYQFQTTPGVDQYNMPLYSLQTEDNVGDTIGMFPVYQGFLGPAYINGIEMPFYTQRSYFNTLWPNDTPDLVQAGTGNGTAARVKKRKSRAGRGRFCRRSGRGNHRAARGRHRHSRKTFLYRRHH